MNQNERAHATAVEQWMISNLTNRGYDRYEDLHIDQIDAGWKPSQMWIEGGLVAFRVALDVRNKLAQDFSVALAFGLRTTGARQHFEIQGLEELSEDLGPSSPSLYLFPKGGEPWAESQIDSAVVEKLASRKLDNLADAVDCYYMEFRQADIDAYFRSFLLVA
jgi:hypothetical protein